MATKLATICQLGVGLSLVGLIHSTVGHNLAEDLQRIAEAKSAKYNCSVSIAFRSAHERVAASHGTVDFESGRGAKVEDEYPWGSVTKMLTGASIMRLISQGAFELDDKVAPLVDPLLARISQESPHQNFSCMADLWGTSNVSHVTVRQLLSMQSGIPDFDTAKPCMNSPGCLPTDPLRKALYTTPNRSYTPSELMTVPWVAHQFKDCKSRLPIGPAFCYSSTNFMLLGLILAAHADVPAKDPWTHFDQGMFLPEYVRKELQFVKHGPPSAYTPVHGYDRTAYNVPAGEHNDHDNWHVDGVFSGWTASNLVATATAVADLAWEVYGPRYSVAPQAYVKQMIPSPKSLYGLATFNLGQITGHKGDYGIAYGHVGATYGYQSIVAYFPKFGVSMTVATNIETDFQAQPMDTMCFAFNAAVGYMLNRTIRCTFSSRGYWSGNCRCDPIDDQVWV